jgi:excisionase family DNA binding protein
MGHTEDAEAIQLVLRWARKSLAPLLRAPATPLLTTGEAASRLGVSDETVRTWARRGLLEAERRGSRFLIPVAAVERELATARVSSTPPRRTSAPARSLGPLVPRERVEPLPAPGSAAAVADREPIRNGVVTRRGAAVRHRGSLAVRLQDRRAAPDTHGG